MKKALKLTFLISGCVWIVTAVSLATIKGIEISRFIQIKKKRIADVFAPEPIE